MSLGFGHQPAPMPPGASDFVGPTNCSDLIDIHILCLTGEGCTLSLSGSALGQEVHQMVLQQFPSKKGRRCLLHYMHSPLLLDQSLRDQGMLSPVATLSCTFVPADLYAAWCYLQGLPISGGELALEGVAHMSGVCSLLRFQLLPITLQSLTFGREFNQTLEGVIFPSGLQSLTFGDKFNHRVGRSYISKSSSKLDIWP